MSEKSCYIYNIVKTRAENTLSPKTYRPNTSALAVEEGYELRTSSLGMTSTGRSQSFYLLIVCDPRLQFQLVPYFNTDVI